MRWQQRARLGIALAGAGFAGTLYFAIGERQARVAPAPPDRLDPTAIVESSGAVARQIRGVKEHYRVQAEHQLSYEGGSSRAINAEITVRARGGRDFVITGREARVGEDQSSIEVGGDVTLAASDGFRMSTGAAAFTESDGLVRAPGALTFGRGRMSGSGTGMTYDKNGDVLSISESVHIAFTDEAGAVTMELEGGSAVFHRGQHLVEAAGGVRTLRSGQTIEADAATAMLNETDEFVVGIELRGAARVVGGSGTFDSMHADAITLDYTDDGAALERVSLAGQAAVALLGPDGGPGRQITGERLNVTVAPDGAITALDASGGVRLDQPGSAQTVRRTITAGTLRATGEPGAGLTLARFDDAVELREAADAPGVRPRVVRARSLSASLTGDGMSGAVFTGTVVVDDENLSAAAGLADYDPVAGSLSLSGVEAGLPPRVEDRLVSVTATTIDVALETHRMAASGNVRTVLQPKAEPGDPDLPGLLSGEGAVNVNGGTLQYDGDAGRVRYAGDVQLWQGDTTIRADQLTLDRASGDLLAAGNARSTFLLDGAAAIGRAEQIRYADAERQVEYGPAPVVAPAGAAVTTPTAPASPAGAPTTVRSPLVKAPAAAAGAGAGTMARVSTTHGDLQSDRIVLALHASDARLDRLEGYGRVQLTLETRTAGGGRLTYFAADERYVISGSPGEPVKVVQGCDETIGKTLTFFKAADRIVVDGGQEIRTQTKSGGTCPQAGSP